MSHLVVVALGGNAILKANQTGNFEEQLANVYETSGPIVSLLRQGYQVVVTHGNGPQVGNILIQNEEASKVVPAMPLDVCGAESQGLIGYMIQQALGNELKRAGLDRPVVSLVTQVLVDPADPAFQKPTKPIGPFYTEKRAQRLMAERGFKMVEDAGRGWRRVVASPEPMAIVEGPTIKALVAAGALVVASGGGGIPVVARDGRLEGVEAVIDKDLAAMRLAADLDAETLLILTDVRGVAVNYGKANQEFLKALTPAEGRAYMAEGHFKSGSMKPKVEAALRFVESSSDGRRRAVIGSLDQAALAAKGQAGTLVRA
ncbi:MAG: carbamate kinase [Bacillota bacterium]